VFYQNKTLAERLPTMGKARTEDGLFGVGTRRRRSRPHPQVVAR